MSRTKDQWIERTGGMRLFETPEMFRGRIVEIRRLEKLFKTGRVGPHNAEQVLRRLCELKGIDFDEHDSNDD